MALETRKHSTWWYGRFTVDGRVHVVNLGVKIGRGSKDREASRSEARQRMDQLRVSMAQPRMAAQTIKTIYRASAGPGARVESVARLAELWEAAPKPRVGSAKYGRQVRAMIAEFGKAVDPRGTMVLDDLGPEHAARFLKGIEAGGVSARTYNSKLITLRSVFSALARVRPELQNPFRSIPTKTEATVHRRPYSRDELQAIVKAAGREPLVRPAIITALCTAMRRGDCCLLKWEDVDLAQRFIAVTTNKTGERVDIPIFDQLYELLSGTRRGKSPYVWPELAAMYRHNQQGVTYRVQKVLAAAGIDRATPRSQGPRVQRASVADFHSFRVTWITMALSAGVPLELVQRVTGHKTTEVVLKHYFRPGRTEFRNALAKAMPGMLAPAEDRDTKIRELLRGMTGKNWAATRDQVLQLMGALTAPV